MAKSAVGLVQVPGLIWLCSPITISVVAQSASASSKVIQIASRATVTGVFTMGAKPVFDVGGVQDIPDNEFDHINGYLRAVTLGDGGIAVIDRVKVRLLDVRGKQRVVVGSFGHRPNEFAELIVHCRTRGDTVIVHDQNARATVISPAGKIVRQIPDAASGQRRRNACFDNGTVVLQKTGSGGTENPTVLLSVVDVKGAIVKSLGEAPTKSYRARLRTPVNTFAQGAFVAVADSHSNEIPQLGDPARAMAFRLGDEIEKAPANVLPSTTAANGTPMQYTASLTWPMYEQMLPGANGSLWIQSYKHDRTEPDVWVPVDAAGKLIGKLSISIPPKPRRRLQIKEFTKDGVLVDYTDSDGATHFQVFRLTLTLGRSQAAAAGANLNTGLASKNASTCSEMQ